MTISSPLRHLSALFTAVLALVIFVPHWQPPSKMEPLTVTVCTQYNGEHCNFIADYKHWNQAFDDATEVCLNTKRIHCRVMLQPGDYVYLGRAPFDPKVSYVGSGMDSTIINLQNVPR